MYIKPQTVIPPGTKINKLPMSDKKVPSLYSLERAHERYLEGETERKAQSEKLTAYLKAGFTVLEAIELLKR